MNENYEPIYQRRPETGFQANVAAAPAVRSLARDGLREQAPRQTAARASSHRAHDSGQ